MLKLIILSTIQSLFLVSSQLFLKVTLEKLGDFKFKLSYLIEFCKTYQAALSGISVAIASILWMYILKNYDFSRAYPMVSISYIFGQLAAYYIFHESIPYTRWIGMLFIILGVFFVAKP